MFVFWKIRLLYFLETTVLRFALLPYYRRISTIFRCLIGSYIYLWELNLDKSSPFVKRQLHFLWHGQQLLCSSRSEFRTQPNIWNGAFRGNSYRLYWWIDIRKWNALTQEKFIRRNWKKKELFFKMSNFSK